MNDSDIDPLSLCAYSKASMACHIQSCLLRRFRLLSQFLTPANAMSQLYYSRQPKKKDEQTAENNAKEDSDSNRHPCTRGRKMNHNGGQVLQNEDKNRDQNHQTEDRSQPDP